MEGNKLAGGAIALTAMLCSSFSGTAQGKTWAGSPRFQTFDDQKPGECPRVVPNHVCLCVNLQDHVYLVAGDKVIERWRAAARGMVVNLSWGEKPGEVPIVFRHKGETR